VSPRFLFLRQVWPQNLDSWGHERRMNGQG